jgi:membrane protein
MTARPRPRLSLSLNGLSTRQLAYQTWKRMAGHDAMIWAAAIAFYALFATVPLLALFLVVTVLRLPDLTGAGGRTSGLGDLTVDQLDATLKSLFPYEAYVLVRDQIARIQAEPPVGLVSVAVVVALWVVSSLSLTAIDALNRTFGVAENRSFLRLRFTALALTLLLSSVLLGSLVAIAAWPQVLRALGLHPDSPVAWLATVIRWVAVFLTVLASLALTFNVGPAARQRWVWITPGTLAGSVAFLAFSALFRVYVQDYGSYDRAYGSLGGIMVLLFWYWVVGMVLLGAAEMDRAVEAGPERGESRGKGYDSGLPPDLQATAPEVGR